MHKRSVNHEILNRLQGGDAILQSVSYSRVSRKVGII